jgi:hypothetical protein
MIKEKDIQSKVVDYARKAGCIARKLDFGQGWPDYLFLFNGQVLFIEFKRPGEKPKPLQLHVHKLLESHGFVVQVVNTVDEGTWFVDLLVNP